MQRVLLFTEVRSLAETAINVFEIIQQEITVSLRGFGLSLVNNLTRQEIMYIGIASSGVIWETCKLNRKRFKPLGLSQFSQFQVVLMQFFLQARKSQCTLKMRINVTCFSKAQILQCLELLLLIIKSRLTLTCNKCTNRDEGK